MAASKQFRAPSMVTQDLDIIMRFVDPPEHPLNLPKVEVVKAQKRKGSPNIVSIYAVEKDDDIASSVAESEDEVEEQVASMLGSGRAKADPTIQTEISDADMSDSDAGSSSSSSVSSFQRRKQAGKRMSSPALEVDFDEDGPPPPATYIPSAHELPLTSVPVPSLPDSSTLPKDALERVGEIMTILPDSVIVRGGGSSGTGQLSMRERRDAVLDEGSLFLLDDRSPLGYVWETFGPTALPHYLVRIKRGEDTSDKKCVPQPALGAPPEPVQTLPETEGDSQLMSAASTSLSDSLDPAKLFISRQIYHIPSLSNFVFPSALARLKGSDASNIHDEEPAEHELEFSDDEAEAAHKRLRNRSSSRAPSHTPYSGPFDGDGDETMSTIGDDAGSLYGASPYDVSAPTQGENIISSSPSSPMGSFDPSSSSAKFDDSAVRDALMLARNSRNRRSSLESMSAAQSTAGTSSPFRGADRSQGKGRGRGRGKERGRPDRGRDRNSRGQGTRGRGRGHGPGMVPESREQGQMLEMDHRASFSFEEYDPHMPRPPSPTSLAIARAIGQWTDGTPFPYGSGDAGHTNVHDTEVNVPQSSYGLQPHSSMSYIQSPQGHYDPSFNYSPAPEYQQYQVSPYGVAPHINPRFAHAFRYPGSAQSTPVVPSVPFLPNLPDPPSSGLRPELSGPESRPRLDD